MAELTWTATDGNVGTLTVTASGRELERNVTLTDAGELYLGVWIIARRAA